MTNDDETPEGFRRLPTRKPGDPVPDPACTACHGEGSVLVPCPDGDLVVVRDGVEYRESCTVAHRARCPKGCPPMLASEIVVGAGMPHGMSNACSLLSPAQQAAIDRVFELIRPIVLCEHPYNSRFYSNVEGATRISCERCGAIRFVGEHWKSLEITTQLAAAIAVWDAAQPENSRTR